MRSDLADPGRRPTGGGGSPSGTVSAKVTVALLAIVAFAFLLRTHRLAELPAGFYCDEAGLGYNAYSLLETGRDETGALLPLYVWSFDVSYKNPVFIYSAIVPVALLGLEERAVRLTSALYGTATVVVIFFLGRVLAGSTCGLLAAALLAVCPWHLHFSRIAFELITFPCLFVAGAACLLASVAGRRRLSAAALCLALSLYTYAIAKLFVPIFLVAFVLLFASTLRARAGESARALLLFLLLGAPLLAFDLTHRDLTTAYFRQTSYLFVEPTAGDALRRFADNYARFFSPEFLLWNGDPLLRHAVQQHGELLPVFAPLLALGLVALFLRRDRPALLVLVWLLLYPVAPSLMTEIPSASRGIIGAPAFSLVAALGATLALRLPSRLGRPSLVVILRTALVATLLAAAGLQLAEYWRAYRDEYPRYSARSYTGFQYGHRAVVEYFLLHRRQYERMIVSTYENNQPQIFLLFYTRYPPAEYQRHGMGAVELDTGMTVGSADDLRFYEKHKKLLFALDEKELSLYADYEVKRRVIAPGGATAFLVVEPRAIKEFVDDWWIAGPFAWDETPPPPALDPDAGPPDESVWREHIGYGRSAVDLNDLRTGAQWYCAWAVNFAYADTSRYVRVFLGLDRDGELWINGEPVPLRWRKEPEEVFPDNALATLHLRQGRNTIAVRTCASYWDWRFYFRMTAPDGSALDDVWWKYE